jgi:hypothetical protein
VFTPVRQAYLHQIIPSAQRATVISFNSMMDSAGGVVGQTGLGYLSDRAGIGTGFVVGGAATFLVIPFLFLLRRLGDPADQIKSGEELPPVGVPAAVIAEET